MAFRPKTCYITQILLHFTLITDEDRLRGVDIALERMEKILKSISHFPLLLAHTPGGDRRGARGYHRRGLRWGPSRALYH